VNQALDATKRVIAVEVNPSGQLATLIRAQTGRSVDGTLLKYDGRAFAPEDILAASG
jgi:2-oxoglutarate ferredoxin oxidoreductase subunit alpha